jgi:hypothetical protein
VVTFGDLLEERKDTIVERWVDAVLAAYPSDSAAIFQAQKDPFANPLGHTVRESTKGVFQVILDGMDRDELRKQLDPIVRIRAVQQLTPPEALSFVFALRSIVQDTIPEAKADPRHGGGIAKLNEQIDQVALAAFELYAARREEVSQLRIGEVKRQVAWVMAKINKQDQALASEAAEDVLEDSSQKTSTYDNVHREDL